MLTDYSPLHVGLVLQIAPPAANWLRRSAPGVVGIRAEESSCLQKLDPGIALKSYRKSHADMTKILCFLGGARKFQANFTIMDYFE